MGRLALAAGASLARTAAALAPQFARSVISNAFQPDVYGPRLAELAIQTSTEGAPVPIVFGRMRLAGQVIWAARFTETAQTRSAGGGKGGPKITEYSYALSFAVGLCEGPIAGVGRVWANGEPLDTGAITMRVHTGGEDQAPDPLIEAVEGAGSAPGYRGLAYVVFEDLPLDPYGQRIPNLSFEVFAASSGGDQPRMEDLVEGVCLIPASGEFAYASEEVVREIEPGFDRTENRHTLRAPSDFEAALDDLQARLPHCRSVALVTAWFGTDLRAGECEIRPGVETRDKETRPLSWSAAGLDRSTAHLVSQVDGSPAYGGTPADATVISAIRALKARGFAVTLYPFILMDVPAGNGLPDPYGGAEQAVYPWRGRITCHPAPGQAGSPDKTAAAAAQMAAFAGTVDAGDFQIGPDSVSYSGPNEWRLSRFILHHCALAAAAGGVESVIIGSEMRGASTVRDGAASYPFVTELKRLAGEARALLGPQTKISYAADWSEYSGHAPADGSGDRIFHLDPFWSDPDVDFIGIDWYGPLADWREGGGHADALAGARSIHDRAYLGGNVEGGEGYDWFYASEADRDAQVRTPITDGAYGEPWIWRYKDLRAFWESGHHDRIGGVRQPAPTAWTPRSKPVRLVELGCPAIDKGANQPNVFIDPKSSESFAPYFSTGARDDLIQRRYVETLLDYWAPANGRNPDSPAYAGPMLDLAHSHVWTWDARPFPEFPAREDVWTDGPNWRLGHWLTGRAGQSSLADIVTGLANRAGLDALDTSGLDGVLAGYVVDRPMPARAAIEQLGRVFGFDIADRASGPACVPVPTASAATPISAARLADTAEADRLAFDRAPRSERMVEARLTIVSDDGDYRAAQTGALGLDTAVNGVIEAGLPALGDRDLAAGWARGLLARAQASAETAAFALPPSLGFLEPGDAVTLDAGPQGRAWRIASLEGASVRRGALIGAPAGPALLSGPEPGAGEPSETVSRPVIALMDLPLGPNQTGRGGLLAAGWARPWPGELVIYAGADLQSATERVRLTAPGFLGTLLDPLAPGPEGRWDRANSVRLRLIDGALESRDRLAALRGEGLVAIETEAGWEAVSFQSATLESPGVWRLETLLRRLGGSPASPASAGARAVVLDGSAAVVPLTEDERGETLTFAAVPPGQSLTSAAARVVQAVWTGAELRPLSPVHLNAAAEGAAIRLSWIRRGRIGADGWGAAIPLGEEREAYRVELIDDAGAVRASHETDAATFLIADPAAVFPEGVTAASFRVAQIGAVYGAGAAAAAPLDPAGHL